MKDDLIKLINELEKEREYQKIITMIEALSDEDKNSKIKLSLAKAYSHINEFDKTIEILESIKASESNTSIWNYCMGHSYYYLDNPSEAERYLLKALEINPEDKPSNFLLALLYHELGDIEEPEEAIHYLNKSLNYFNVYSKLDAEEDITEDLISIEQKLAWNYDKLRNHKEAEIHLRKAILLGDNEEWVYSQLAYNLRSQERYEEALENYQKVIELGRRDTWLYSEIAWTYFLIKKPQLALNYMKKAKELSPVEVDLALITRTASILLALAEHKKAIKMIEEVISKEEYKNDINLLSNLAYIYIDLKDYESALIYLQRLKELGRNDEWLNKNLILVYSKLENIN